MFHRTSTTFSEGEVYEQPVHTVNVSAFYLDKYEVTKGLWDQVKAWNGGNGHSYDNDGSGKATNHPVQSINWFDMVKCLISTILRGTGSTARGAGTMGLKVGLWASGRDRFDFDLTPAPCNLHHEP